MSKLRVVSYLRVSTDRQAEDGYGLDSQRRAIEIWAARNQIEVVTTYTDEGVSGSETLENRVGLPLAMATADEAGLDGIVVYKLDRLARDLILQETILRDIVRRGRKLYSTFEGEQSLLDDPDDPTRTLIRQIIGSFSEYERSMIRLRLMSGKRIKRAQGGYIGGTPPYGTKSLGGGELEIEPAEAAILEEMAEIRATGVGYQKVADQLNERGHTTRSGGQWTAKRVQDILKRAAPSLTEHKGRSYGGPNRWGNAEKAKKRHRLEKQLRELNAS